MAAVELNYLTSSLDVGYHLYDQIVVLVLLLIEGGIFHDERTIQGVWIE